LYDIASKRRTASADRARCRTAILAPSPLSYGIAHLYETLMHGSNIEVRVAPTPDAAADWLSVPHTIIAPPPPLHV
jgi:hypothetical protein